MLDNKSSEMQIKECENKLQKLNHSFINEKEDIVINTARGSLLFYSVGAITTPITLISGHPHLAMVTTGAAIASLSTFTLTLGAVVANGKKTDKLKQKIKQLKLQSN